MISVGKSLQFKNRTYFFSLYLFLMILFLTSTVFCQDSLHLTGTITGESNAKRITDVKGIGDVNGDGYDDFMVTTANNTITLYLGSQNFNFTPSIIFHYPGKDSLYGFGGCAGIGDVNGDGYNDFIIRGSFNKWGFGKGKVFLYYGGLKIDTIPKYEFYEPWIQDNFGFDVEGVGDVNKDGYSDFIVSSPYNWTDGIAKVYLFWGGDTISFTRSITFSDTSGGYFGKSVANIGDVSGDGFDDIAIGVEGPSAGSGGVYIYHGGMAMDNIPDEALSSKSVDNSFGRIIKIAGDLNRNGVKDFFVASESNIYLYSGRNLEFTIKGEALGGSGYVNIQSNCDLNNDGYNDYIIGNSNYRNSDSVMVGGAFVYFGEKKIDTVYKFKLEGENKWDEFSRTMTSADINGDGYDELFIMAPDYPDYNTPLGKIYIYSFKKLTEVKEHRQIVPYKFDLFQNYPNPFNPTTIIRYELPITSNVSVKVYDMLGREVVTLVDGIKEAGIYTASFHGDNLATGIYFARLITTPQDGSKPFNQTMKMLMVK